MDSVGFIQLRWKYQLLILTGRVASAEAVSLLCLPWYLSCSPADWQCRDGAECHSISQPLQSLHATWFRIFSVSLRKEKVCYEWIYHLIAATQSSDKFCSLGNRDVYRLWWFLSTKILSAWMAFLTECNFSEGWNIFPVSLWGSGFPNSLWPLLQ